MKIITSTSLSGGQGKTTTVFFLGKMLAHKGYKVLFVDSDPQANLTFFLGHEIGPTDATILEVIIENVPVGIRETITVTPEDGIRELTTVEGGWIIPASNALERAQTYLSQSGVDPSSQLKERLNKVSDIFDFCLIDSPPQRSHLSVACIGAADSIIIPAEAQVKGVGSVDRTVSLIREMKRKNACSANILCILPFRDRWVGYNRTGESEESINVMKEFGEEVLSATIRESEQYKKALNQGMLLDEIGYPQLAYPFELIIEKLQVKVAA
ncbi:Cobyrinic acid ac-diamide synthase (plasmid) [Thalassoporum mexicanum PCC 7367]|uniref:ParA family protein n=1 Tax=Thalassoporum mexicanum TaxID=3457544 RepID=UPI00029FE59D|nr:ParA family protein [Pseudanabaena sp. PCC 7367]AFY71920.1 Cobyrinic acid ac-diamide synthase [Pseudanabaena sp. PCC 7367]